MGVLIDVLFLVAIIFAYQIVVTSRCVLCLWNNLTGFFGTDRGIKAKSREMGEGSILMEGS